jgi:hypothetical protein
MAKLRQTAPPFLSRRGDGRLQAPPRTPAPLSSVVHSRARFPSSEGVSEPRRLRRVRRGMFCRPSRSRRLGNGGLPERTKGHAWRACRGQPLAGSNPAATARRVNAAPDQAIRHPGQRCGATGPGSCSISSRDSRTSSNVSHGRNGTPSPRQILTRSFLANTMSEYRAP